MKKQSLQLVIIILLAATSAFAKSSNYVFTGREIYESCTHAVAALDKSGEYDEHRFGACAGYISGIVDFHTVATTVESMSQDMFCLPKNISTAKVIRVVTHYLQQHPEKLNDLAAYLVTLALHETYPCEDQASPK